MIPPSLHTSVDYGDWQTQSALSSTGDPSSAKWGRAEAPKERRYDFKIREVH